MSESLITESVADGQSITNGYMEMATVEGAVPSLKNLTWVCQLIVSCTKPEY